MTRALLVLALAACGTPAPRCELPKYSAPHGAPFLWHVTKAGAPGAVILFGTIHTASTPDVAKPVWDALASAQHYASELGDKEPDKDKFIELARIPYGGKSLDGLLANDDWWALDDALHGTIHTEDLRHAKPWYAMIKLMAKVAPAPKPSMDDALTARASEHHLPIDALETWEVQLAALDAAVAPSDLADAIHARRSIRCSQDQTQAAYLASDAEALKIKLLVDSSHLISDRNTVWLPKIEAYVDATGTTFVAVGLGHLLGDGGLPTLLARAGYTVTR